MADSNTNSECAARLAAAGLVVFPCDPKNRTPLFKGWQTLSATMPPRSRSWWAQWPGAVPALDLARCGLVVLDGDRHHPGVDGVAALRELLRQQPGLGRRGAADGEDAARRRARLLSSSAEPALGNSRGGLPAGIDVRGAGGFVLAPGAMLGNRPQLRADRRPARAGRRVRRQEHPGGAGRHRRPARAGAAARQGTGGAPRRPGQRARARLRAGRAAPQRRRARRGGAGRPQQRAQPGGLPHGHDGGARLADARTRSRTRSAAPWRPTATCATRAPRRSPPRWRPGLAAGLQSPHDDLPNGGVSLDDFVAYLPAHYYIFMPCREPWPARGVDARLGKVSVTDADGAAKEIRASAWLDVHRPVEQMTWAPGEPQLIRDRLVVHGGWIERPGVTTLNLYRPPLIDPGNAAEADPWLDHVHKVYPDDADHIIRGWRTGCSGRRRRSITRWCWAAARASARTRCWSRSSTRSARGIFWRYRRRPCSAASTAS